MSVEINIPQFLQHLASDKKSVDVQGRTVGECLGVLVKQYPQLKSWLFNKKGKLLKKLNVYVNGESAYPEELAKPVNDGDKLHLAYLIVGG
jgi:molybdopterin converting factor small subunit